MDEESGLRAGEFRQQALSLDFPTFEPLKFPHDPGDQGGVGIPPQGFES